MLPPVCFTCRHVFADIQIPYDTDMELIENDPKMNEQEKNIAKSKLLDKYYITNYCCRMRVLGYVKLVNIIT
jgi:DNA-directed RNA polymerase subunit N (RpoN/RPB10)